MKCPFCHDEIEPVEITSENRVEYHCPRCQSIVAAYQKGMEPVLKNLVSMDRFERNTK
jgi:Zn finger protein HypA/HybF involved in hydrogenase expression